MCRSKRRGALPPPLNPETATLDTMALQHLRCLVLSCRSKRRGALPPPLNPETATLGSVTLQHLRCLVLSCRTKRRGALPPPLNPETATLGSVALQHLRNLKIKQCTEELHSIGFIEGAAEMARKCGGDTNVAAQYLAEGRQTSLLS